MTNVLKEVFLHDYFMLDAVVGGHIDHGSLFRVLSDIYCLSAEEVKGLFELTESDAVKEIATEGDYNRYKRIKQYNSMIGYDRGATEAEDAMISIKGAALTAAAACDMAAGPEKAWLNVIKNLMDEAQKGKILALRILGVLQSEGITVEKNVSDGTNNLLKATRWGDFPSALALMKYSQIDKNLLATYLNACVKDTPYEFLSGIAAEKYGATDCGRSDEISLIRRAFGTGKAKPDVFDPSVAKIAFCETMKLKCKENVILSGSKEMIAEACDLPLGIRFGEIVVEESAFDTAVINRKGEKEGIVRALGNSDLRGRKGFRPLCVCSDSEFVLDAYEAAICNSLSDTHVERIEVADLREQNLELTKNNVFLRGLSERKNNAFLLVFKGDISDGLVEHIMGIVRSENRRKFCLNVPSVSLDLSSVLPICVCDCENARKLEDYVDLVELSEVAAEEKPAVVRAIVEKRGRFYGLGEVTVSEEAMDRICALSAEEAGKTIDAVLRGHRVKNGVIELNAEMLGPYLKNKNGANNSYGFGGIIDESK